jgi:hypothetical protein
MVLGKKLTAPPWVIRWAAFTVGLFIFAGGGIVIK